ncbi:MAG: UDP-N-acetylmuramoyl-L-alanine--D-glutamate ligase, partial [Muribaculaceae bacterium]|nr:UDP-N-acetylmuramoyl-L-alanine--D-glutamate ligase [Muribaculaceae bacterium]
AMGLHNEKIMECFEDKVPRLVSTDSLADAIKACQELSGEGDTVLLSPCCASFDLFSSYVDRGNKFKQAVNSLK